MLLKRVALKSLGSAVFEGLSKKEKHIFLMRKKHIVMRCDDLRPDRLPPLEWHREQLAQHGWQVCEVISELRWEARNRKSWDVEQFFVFFLQRFLNEFDYSLISIAWFFMSRLMPTFARKSILVRCGDVAAPEVSVSSLFHVLVARCKSLRVEMPVLPQRWRLVHLSGVVEKAKTSGEWCNG